MLRSKVEVYIHLVWTTYRRAAVLSGALERDVYAVIIAEAKGLRCEVVGIGGMPDHVHVVVRLNPTVSISKLVQQMKGVSSTFANKHFELPEWFRWQERYGCFGFAKADLDSVLTYVRNQKQHHSGPQLRPELEDTEEEATTPVPAH